MKTWQIEVIKQYENLTAFEFIGKDEIHNDKSFWEKWDINFNRRVINMKTNVIDEAKMAYFIRTESPKLFVFIRDDIPGNLQEFCRRIKYQIRQNINGDTETAGFDVIWKTDKGEPFGCRLVDRSTQIPCTKWHSRYDLALKELYSIVEK